MTMIRPHVLMLDVDGVLVTGRPRDGAPPLTSLEADLGLSPQLLQSHFFDVHWEKIVTGRAPLKPRLDAFLSGHALRIGADELLQYWFRNDARIDEAVLAGVRAWRRAGGRAILATNQEHLRASYLMDELDLRAQVDGIVYSAALGYRKPAPDFFIAAAASAEVTPGDIVFIDDSIGNVEAARQAGWRSTHWRAGMTLAAAIAAAY